MAFMLCSQAKNSCGKNTVCNSQYSPRTWLVRGMYFVREMEMCVVEGGGIQLNKVSDMKYVNISQGVANRKSASY